MMNELYDRQKWEQIKKEITDDVMSRIKINISADTTIIDELIKKIEKLGKWRKEHLKCLILLHTQIRELSTYTERRQNQIFSV